MSEATSFHTLLTQLMLATNLEKQEPSRATSLSMPSRPQTRRLSKAIKQETDSLPEMQFNLPQQDNRIKTRISLVTRLRPLLFSHCLTLPQRPRRLEPTITSQALPSPSRTQAREELQDPLYTVRMRNGRALFSGDQQIISQQGNALPRKALATKACGAMNKLSGKRRSHSLQ